MIPFETWLPAFRSASPSPDARCFSASSKQICTGGSDREMGIEAFLKHNDGDRRPLDFPALVNYSAPLSRWNSGIVEYGKSTRNHERRGNDHR